MALNVSTSDLYSKSLDAKKIGNNLESVITSVTQVKFSLSYEISRESSVSVSMNSVLSALTQQQKKMEEIQNFLQKAAQDYENAEQQLLQLSGGQMEEEKSFGLWDDVPSNLISGIADQNYGFAAVVAVGTVVGSITNKEDFLSAENRWNMGKAILTLGKKGVDCNFSMKNMFSIGAKKATSNALLSSSGQYLKGVVKTSLTALDFSFDFASSFIENNSEHASLTDDYGRGWREVFTEAGIDFVMGTAVKKGVGLLASGAATLAFGANPATWVVVGTAAVTVVGTSFIMSAWDNSGWLEVASDGLNDFGEGAVKLAYDVGKGAVKATESLISATGDLISTGAKAVYDVGKSAVAAGGELISSATELASTTAAVSKDVLNTIADVGEASVTAAKEAVSSAVSTASNMASSAATAVTTGASKAVSGIASAWNKICS